jgi:hypothetical protein
MSSSSPQPVSSTEPRRFPGVQLGGMLFTLVEPWRDRQVDYNRWYEADHFYATLFGPGVFAGRRFVCTSALKQLREVGDKQVVPAAGIGSYLALYWMTRTSEFNEWGAANSLALHDAGRIFVERDHIHTLMYDLDSWMGRDQSAVPPEIALDHPFAFLVVEVLAGPDIGRRVRDELAPDAIARGAALVLTFRPVPLLDDRPADVPSATGTGDFRLLLHFHDGGSAEDAMAALAAADRATVRFRSPFVPTIPGTDCYTDALW